MTSRERVIAALERRQPDRVPLFECVIDERLMQAILPGCDYHQFAEFIGLDNASPNRSSWSRENVEIIDERRGLFRDKWGVIRAFGPESTPAPVEVGEQPGPPGFEPSPRPVGRPSVSVSGAVGRPATTRFCDRLLIWDRSRAFHGRIPAMIEAMRAAGYTWVVTDEGNILSRLPAAFARGGCQAGDCLTYDLHAGEQYDVSDY